MKYKIEYEVILLNYFNILDLVITRYGLLYFPVFEGNSLIKPLFDNGLFKEAFVFKIVTIFFMSLTLYYAYKYYDLKGEVLLAKTMKYSLRFSWIIYMLVTISNLWVMYFV